MKVKLFVIIGSILVVLALIGTVVAVMMNGGEPEFKEEVPSLDEIPSDTVHFEPTGEVMIPHEGEVYWPIHGPMNSTEVILVTGVQVHIVWSDDEQPPALRPMYQNMPDTMSLEVNAKPYLRSLETTGNDTGNETGTVSTVSHSESGNTRVDQDLKAMPVRLEEGTDTNISFDPAGSADGGNTGLYIKVSCIAGHIESSRPALLRYNDRGDEITMTISLTVKRVPLEVFDAWVESQTRESEW